MMCNTEIHDICNNVNNKASTIIKLSSQCQSCHQLSTTQILFLLYQSSPDPPSQNFDWLDFGGLASVTVLPTYEKSRSDCAELADMANTRRATVDRMGYCLVWSFQNWRGAV